jgi:dihydroorotate dehydrogenase (NAD+) catalytic subunit
VTSSLSVDVGRLVLRNPVLVASGTFGAGLEALEQGVDLSAIGGVVTKSVTTQCRAGNPPPRICETASGMLNSIGIMNPGVDGFLAEIMPAFSRIPCARVVNVAGESAEDFETLVARFDAVDGCDAIELNVSCPNVSGGLDFGVDTASSRHSYGAAAPARASRFGSNLRANVTDVVPLARAAVAARMRSH